MKIHDVVQNSPEWEALRTGIPTASAFSNILTPSLKRSQSREKYMHKLIAERLLGRSLDEYKSRPMEQGSALEKEAYVEFQFLTDLKAEPVGFVTNDEETWGASPDAFVEAEETLEIKCPTLPEHIGHALNHGATYREHILQVQGQLWVCERKAAWVMSYNPMMPVALERVERDEKVITAIAKEVTAFSAELESLYRELVGKGWTAVKPVRPDNLVDILRDSLTAAQESA